MSNENTNWKWTTILTVIIGLVLIALAGIAANCTMHGYDKNQTMFGRPLVKPKESEA